MLSVSSQCQGVCAAAGDNGENSEKQDQLEQTEVSFHASEGEQHSVLTQCVLMLPHYAWKFHLSQESLFHPSTPLAFPLHCNLLKCAMLLLLALGLCRLLFQLPHQTAVVGEGETALWFKASHAIRLQLWKM